MISVGTQPFTQQEPPSLPLKIQLRIKLYRLVRWMGRQEHRKWLEENCQKLGEAFTAHPAATQETYLEHLWFTAKTSLRLASIGFILFIHGLFPFLFTRTVSAQVERIYLMMRSRIPQARRDEIEHQYDI